MGREAPMAAALGNCHQREPPSPPPGSARVRRRGRHVTRAVTIRRRRDQPTPMQEDDATERMILLIKGEYNHDLVDQGRVQ